VRGKLLELLALGDEVGLAVQLDHGALGCGDQAVGRGALGAALDRLGHALDPQDLGGLGEVAVGLLQSALGIHHSGAGGVAKLLDISGGEVRHRGRFRPALLGSVLGWCSPGAYRPRWCYSAAASARWPAAAKPAFSACSGVANHTSAT